MRRKKTYFPKLTDGPKPISATITRRVNFSEVDAMAISWHGRYVTYFEEASAELGRKSGMSFKDFYDYNLRAPIAQLHIDYHQPLVLEELFTVQASMIWSDAAKINTEYKIIKEDGSIACTGYMVQLFVDAKNSEVCWFIPELYKRCRERWLAGELK